MKTKRTFLSILTLCIALLFTACSGKEAASTEKSQDTKTESSSVSTDDSNSKLDNLYQQENQIFADHEDVWNKAFGMMSKSAADQNGNYADYLADTVESNKDSFTDDELKTLTADIETIRKIEEQIAEIEKKNTGSDNTDQKNSSKDASPFKNFSGQDYDGNSVDESLFSKNAVTVINFWFTGCKPCVAELSKLNELNDAIKSMGGEVVGINTGKHRFRHIVFHENKGLSADIAHTHKMIAAVPTFELEPCKQFRGITYPLCTQHLGTVFQVQNPHLGGKAQLLVQEAAAGIGAAHKSTAAPHAFHKAFFDQHIVSLPRNGA